MKNNILELEIDSQFAKSIGYTSDKFYKETSCLQIDNDSIYIITIQSRNLIESMSSTYSKVKGYFKELCNNILKSGYNIKIIDPILKMQEIVIKEKYELTYEKSKNFTFPYSELLTGEENVEVWTKITKEDKK